MANRNTLGKPRAGKLQLSGLMELRMGVWHATPAPARDLGPSGALVGEDKFLNSDWFSQEERQLPLGNA
jgi:hypothetical protein